MATAYKLLLNYNPMENFSGATSDGITFANDGRPSTQKDKSNITCFRCGVSGHYSTENACKQEDIDEYNATNKMNETRNSSPYANNDKRRTEKQVGDTGAQMLMAGLEIDDFDYSPYYLIFLNNEIQNEEIAEDHRSGNIFTISTSHENILSQAKGDINLNWVSIENKSTVHVLCNPKLLNNIRRTDQKIHLFCNAGMETTDVVGEMPGVG